MKYKLTKLFILFVTMSVLTSSRGDEGTCKVCQPVADKHSCLDTVNDYAVNVSCTETLVVPAKNDDARAEAFADNEISLSPISRFILVQ